MTRTSPTRKRSDTIGAAVDTARASARKLTPPPHVPLEPCDDPFWEAVLAEFARSEWTDHQLQLAAMLSRTMADLEREQRTLRTEGFIATRENGTTVENPRARAVKSLTGDILALRRSLALHARARSGEARDVAKRRTRAKAVEDDLNPRSSLLASPPESIQ